MLKPHPNDSIVGPTSSRKREGVYFCFFWLSFPIPNISFLNVIKHKGGMQGNKDRETTVPRDAGLGRRTMDENAWHMGHKGIEIAREIGLKGISFLYLPSSYLLATDPY
jgi:hypothetical protein